MADVAIVACDAVLPNLRETILFCGRMHAQGHPTPATCSDTVKPRTPRKLRHADLRDLPGCLRKTSYEAAVAAAFPHRHVTTPVPPGFPGAPPAPLCSTARVLPHRQQRRLLALARPRAMGDRRLRGSYLSLLPGRRGARHQHWGLVGPAGSEQSWKTGARAGFGCREQSGMACSVRCREELHGFSSSHGLLAPALPRAAALAAGTIQTH